jgi:Protein of unknown function (DUF3800)
MKFVYVDESGSSGEGDVFVMAGILVDAYRLRKHTIKFDNMISALLENHPGLRKELKTKRMINGEGGWSAVDADVRKQFLRDICDLAKECARIFSIALSFEKHAVAIADGHQQPFDKSYWLGAALFIAGLIQKKMQIGKKNKGLTVLICDDNKKEMQNLSDALYAADAWFDPIYQQSKSKNGQTIWIPIPEDQRFDQIVNTAFAIKSEHSSLVQIADAVAYIHRRHLELLNSPENWVGEKEYFADLVDRLPKHERLGRNPGGHCIDFYQAVRVNDWQI